MIIGIALLWVSFFSISNIPKWLNFKPFNCIICLSFWSSLIAYVLPELLPGTQTIITAIEWGGIGAYASIIFKRIYFKF